MLNSDDEREKAREYSDVMFVVLLVLIVAGITLYKVFH